MIASCTWDEVTGVDGYNVYLSENSGPFVKQNATLITTLNYNIEDLEPGDYEAYVTSVESDIESEPSVIDSFTVEEPSQTIFETDFSEYAENSTLQENGWTARWKQGKQFDVRLDGSPAIIEPVIGTKWAETDHGSGNGRRLLSYPNADLIGDTEILALVCIGNDGVSDALRIHIRSTGSAGSEKGYFITFSSGNISLAKYNSSSQSIGMSGNFENYSTPPPPRMWVRFSMIGNSIKVKVWEYGTAEPAAWSTSTVDNEFASGYAGLGYFSDGGQEWVDYFAVSDGTTIELPA